MIRAAIIFFFVAVIAFLFGATGFAGFSMQVGQVLLAVFLVAGAISLMGAMVTGKTPLTKGIRSNEMNENVVKGNWKEIKSDLQKSWGKLTDDELEKTKGDMKAIGGLLQQRYGETQDFYSKKVADIFHRSESHSS